MASCATFRLEQRDGVLISRNTLSGVGGRPTVTEPEDLSQPRTMGSVARIVRLLEAVAASDSHVGVRALARESGIDKSAVSRLLRQLTDLDVLEPSDVAGRASKPLRHITSQAQSACTSMRSPARGISTDNGTAT